MLLLRYIVLSYIVVLNYMFIIKVSDAIDPLICSVFLRPDSKKSMDNKSYQIFTYIYFK